MAPDTSAREVAAVAPRALAGPAFA